MNDTLRYYDQHAGEFADHTRNVDFTEHQDKFLAYLKSGAKILDFGCGSGRDTKYFLEKGFAVDAIDGSAELAKIASIYTGIKVKKMMFQELSVENAYDGIWACASILHLNDTDLEKVLKKMGRALVCGGIIYTSFKYGTDETERNGRFFMDMTESKWEDVIANVAVLKTKELWITSDVRPGREAEKWLNLILQKN